MNEDRPLAADAGETRVDLYALARRGAQLEGDFALASMSRLASALSEPAASARVRWTLRAALRQLPGDGTQPSAELEVAAEVPLQCQRCLGTVRVPVVDRARFRLVDVEPELSDDELEADDEALCAADPVDLRELVEDQLLLALPLVPMHDACPQPLAAPVSDEAIAATSPFAALARLKRD
jgi:uncharacterized protein